LAALTAAATRCLSVAAATETEAVVMQDVTPASMVEQESEALEVEGEV
jgi:hypothetical protein